MTLQADRVGEGARIVLVHGGFSNRRVWGYQLLDLGRRFEVTAVDLPGHGASPWTRSDDWFSDAVAQLGAFDALQRDGHVTLVGWSIGAAVAARVAAARPDTTLVAVAANGKPRPEGAAAAIEKLASGDFPRYAHSIVRTFSPLASADTEQWLLDLALRNDLDASIAALTTALPVDELPPGSVVVHGALDTLTPPDDRPRGGAADVVLPRAGHAVFLDARRDFNDLLAKVANGESLDAQGVAS